MAARQRYVIATVCAVVGLIAAIGAPVKFESLSFLRPTAIEFQLQPHVNSDGSASVVLEGLRAGEVPLFNQHTMVNLYRADRSISTAVDFGGLEALGIDNPMFRGQTWTPNNTGGQQFKVLITTKTPDTVAALIDYRSLYVPTKPIKIAALRQSSLSDFAPLITDFLPFMTGHNCFSELQRGDFLTTRCPEFAYQAPYKLDYNPSSRALTITPTHHEMWDTLRVYEQGVIFTYSKDPFGKYSPGASLPKTRLATNLPRAVNNLGGFVMQAGPSGNGGDEGAEDGGIDTQDAAPNGDVDEDSNGSHQEPPRYITEDCDSDKVDFLPHRGVEINGLRHEGKRVLLGPDLPDPTGKRLEDYTNRCNSLIAQNVSAPIWDPNKACPGLAGCPAGCSGGCELAGFFFKFGNVLEGWERISFERYGGQVWCHVPSVPEQPNKLRIEVSCSPCESLVASSSSDPATSSSSTSDTSEEPTTSTSSEPVSSGTSESLTSQASSANPAEPINASSSKSSDATKSEPSSTNDLRSPIIFFREQCGGTNTLMVRYKGPALKEELGMSCQPKRNLLQTEDQYEHLMRVHEASLKDAKVRCAQIVSRSNTNHPTVAGFIGKCPHACPENNAGCANENGDGWYTLGYYGNDFAVRMVKVAEDDQSICYDLYCQSAASPTSGDSLKADYAWKCTGCESIELASLSTSQTTETITSSTSSPSSDYAASSEYSASIESSSSSEAGMTTSNDYIE